MDPEQKRSLQDIMPPARRRPTRPAIESSSGAMPEMRPKKKGGFPIVITAIVVLLLAAVGVVFGLSAVYEKATVKLAPRAFAVTEANATIPGQKDGDGSLLAYTVASTEKIGTRTVPATGTTDVSETAKGKLTVYNMASTPQQLIIRTRFEAGDGLWFRTPKNVTVPGKTTKDGKDIPGSLEIDVVADEAGDKYNIGPSDFTLPGLKEDAVKYKQVYAKSTAPMTGGFQGKKPTVDKAVEEQNRKEMREELSKTLIEEAKQNIPEGYFAIDSLIYTSYSSEPSTAAESGAQLREKGTAYAILLPTLGFAKALAKSVVPNFTDENVAIEGMEGLQISFSEKTTTPWNESTLTFTVAGTAKLLWTIPEAAIKEELVGKDKEALETVMKGFPSVDQAEVVMTPAWGSSFPSDPAKIIIEVGAPITE